MGTMHWSWRRYENSLQHSQLYVIEHWVLWSITSSRWNKLFIWRWFSYLATFAAVRFNSLFPSSNLLIINILRVSLAWTWTWRERDNARYHFALVLPLTILTAWIVIAFQSKYIFLAGTGFGKRLAWPFFLFHNMISLPWIRFYMTLSWLSVFSLFLLGWIHTYISSGDIMNIQVCYVWLINILGNGVTTAQSKSAVSIGHSSYIWYHQLEWAFHQSTTLFAWVSCLV